VLVCLLSGYWHYILPLAALLPLSLLGIIEADMLYQFIKNAARSKTAGSNASSIAAQQGKLALAAAACESTFPILWLETGRLWGNACRSNNCIVAAGVAALAPVVAALISSSSGRSCMSGTGCSAGGGLGRTFCRKFEWHCGAMAGAKRHEQLQALRQFAFYMAAVAAQATIVYMHITGGNSSGWGWLAAGVTAVVHVGAVTFLIWLRLTKQRC
jgi:hypothetical protein